MGRTSAGNHASSGTLLRKELMLMELRDLTPGDEAARNWSESVVRPDEEKARLRCCSINMYECRHKTMPYRCRNCKNYFSIKTGNLPLRKWVRTSYLQNVIFKGCGLYEAAPRSRC